MRFGSILVAGSYGFLGSSLVRHLESQGQDIVYGVRAAKLVRLDPAERSKSVGIDSDLEQLSRILRERNVTSVVNCVAEYGRDHQPAAQLIESNLQFPLRLLEACEQSGVNTFVNCNTSLKSEVSSYALSKNQFSPWLEARSRVPRRIDVALEYFYGEHEPENRLISRMIQVCLDPNDTMELSPGDQRRDFIHVDDVSTGLCRLMTLPAVADGFHRVAIGSGNAVSLRELAATIVSLAGQGKDRIHFGVHPYRPHEVMEACADIGLMRQLGWRPRVQLREGLSRCIQRKQTRRRAA